MNLKPLTSLRFFFAIMVMASHMFFLDTSPFFHNFFNKVMHEGFLGVSFFYILSGFILSLNYCELNLQKVNIIKFYKARIAMIYPIHLITLIVALIFVVKEFDWQTFLMQLTLTQSFSPIEKVFFSFNAPSWSISDEFFFYLLFPLLIVVFRKISTLYKFLIFAIMTAVILALNVYLPADKKHYYIYVFPISRLADFVLGILLFQICRFLRTKNLSSNTILTFQFISILVFIIAFLGHQYINISYRYSIYYWLPMCLIILSLASAYYSNTESIFTKILSNKTLVYLGQVSFAFYMTHLLVIEILDYNFNIPNYILKAFLIFIITLIVSIIVFEKIEKPANKLIKTL